MKILPLAAELNATLEKNAPDVLAMLSGLGQRLYFPKGIVSQAAEAKERAHRYNATIGIATESGGPMHLATAQELFAMKPAEIYPYAPTAGRADLRQLWREKQLAENPSLAGKLTSQPIVTSALTHGLSVVGDLFVGEGDTIVLPEHFWGNYRLTFEVRLGARIETFPLYEGAGFNVEGLRKKLAEVGARTDKAIVILNFPNNPTGYTPSRSEGDGIRAALVEAAERGLRVVAVCDDAYFGLFYDDDCLTESVFGLLAGAHPRVLAVKLDGATKELFAWGFRVGFLTFAAAGAGDLAAVHAALEKKATGSIRGGISNSPHATQAAVAHLLRNPATPAERQSKRDLLAARAARTHEVLARPEFGEAWTPYPFNSGYFMCVRLHGGVDAEALRLHLLDKFGVGVISSGATDIRVAFSCLEVEEIEDVFSCLHRAWLDLAGNA